MASAMETRGRNVDRFRARYAPDLRSVASHGDWMNRALGFRNNEFVTAELLAACDLDFEAYDESVLGRADAYVPSVRPSSTYDFWI